MKADFAGRYPSGGHFPRKLKIDRLGIHATRVQIENLMDDVRELESQLEASNSALNAYRLRVQTDFDELRMKFEAELNGHLNSQSELHEQKLKSLRENLFESSAEITRLNEKLNHRAVVQWSPRLLIEKGSQASTQSRIVLVQSIVRGFLARTRVRRALTYIAAKQSGVLIALKKTKQGNSWLSWFSLPPFLIVFFNLWCCILTGETGWYVEPSGKIYYFVLIKVEIVYAKNLV